jgi:hypothetical protein
MSEQHIRLIVAGAVFLVFVGAIMAICRNHCQPYHRSRIMVFSVSIAFVAAIMVTVSWLWIPAAFLLLVSEWFLDSIDDSLATIFGKLHLGAIAFLTLDTFAEAMVHAHQMHHMPAIAPYAVHGQPLIEQLAIFVVMAIVYMTVITSGLVQRLARRFGEWELRFAMRNMRMEYVRFDDEGKE